MPFVKDFASRSFYFLFLRRVGSDGVACISQSMDSRYIDKYATIISDHLAPRYIRFPQNEDEITATKMAFEQRYNIPGVVGIVDGTHIALSAVPGDIEIAYVNRKHFHSINVQIVCDANLIITDINARYAGSTHDSYIFQSSRLSAFLQQYYQDHQNEWTYLLGIIHIICFKLQKMILFLLN